MAQYEIPARNIGGLVAKLEALNKRAAKLKVEPATFEIVETITRTYKHEITAVEYQKTFYVVNVEGQAPKLNGWSFVAKLTPILDKNLVALLPGVDDVPTYFRTSGMICQHCNQNRFRKECFVLVDESGKHIQVGRNCLADFLGGSSPDRLAAIAEWDIALREAMDGGFDGYGGEPAEDTAAFVATVAALIRTVGWSSRQNERDGGDRSTASRAFEISTSAKEYELFVKYHPDFSVTEEDKTLAQAALAWTQTLSDDNNFEYNLKLACQQPAVVYKTAGFVAAAVNGYRRSIQEKIEKAAKPVSAYVGTIGKRETFRDLMVTNVLTFDGFYGPTYFCTFIDPNGNVLVWKTSSPDDEIEQGKKVSLVASVKDHSLYRDVQQTIITRAKLL